MNKTILYGYQLQDGKLAVHPKEAGGVKRIFSLYLAGMTQQQIAEDLNAKEFFYSPESPTWARYRIRRALQNSRYAGGKGYPALIDSETFRMAQVIREDRMRKRGDHPALCLLYPENRGEPRLGAGWHLRRQGHHGDEHEEAGGV